MEQLYWSQRLPAVTGLKKGTQNSLSSHICTYMYAINKSIPRIPYMCKQNHTLVELISCDDFQMVCCYTRSLWMRQDLPAVSSLRMS